MNFKHYCGIGFIFVIIYVVTFIFDYLYPSSLVNLAGYGTFLIISTRFSFKERKYVFGIIHLLFLVATTIVLGVMTLPDGVAAAFYEEVITRGWLLLGLLLMFQSSSRISKKRANWVALLISSIAFTLPHLHLYDWMGLGYIFILGFCCGVFYMASRSIIPSILTHLTWNWIRLPELAMYRSVLSLLVLFILIGLASVVGCRFLRQGQEISRDKCLRQEEPEEEEEEEKL